ERRRALSAEAATRGAALLERARERGGPTDEERGAALEALGCALALDPDNGAARSALLRILTEPPKETPPEVKERVARAFDEPCAWACVSTCRCCSRGCCFCPSRSTRASATAGC